MWVALAATCACALAADPEPAGGEVLGRLELDARRAGEHVALLLGVVLELLGEVARHRRCRTARAGRGRSATSSTWKSLGTIRRSRDRIWALLSHSRCRAAAISTGCTALRNALAKAPEITCSSLCSKRCSPPMSDRLLPCMRRSAPVRTLPAIAIGAGAALRLRTTARPGRGPVRFGDALRAGIACARFTREWRNRQTRTVQVRVSERTWGFNSPLAHPRTSPRPVLRSGASSSLQPQARLRRVTALRFLGGKVDTCARCPVDPGGSVGTASPSGSER